MSAPSDDATLLIFAVRYALGRRTFAPKIVHGALVRHQKWLTADDAEKLVAEIEEHGEKHGFGDPCDADTWEGTLDWLGEMLERGLFSPASAVSGVER